MNNQTDLSPATKRDLALQKEELIERIDGVEQKLSKRIDGVETRIDKVEKNLGGRIESLESDVQTLAGQVAKHDANLNSLRVDLNEKFDMILQWFDKVSMQINDLRTEKAAAEHTFLRHEKRLDEHEERLSKLEAKIS